MKLQRLRDQTDPDCSPKREHSTNPVSIIGEKRKHESQPTEPSPKS
jgi:hypothetical protein